ncbi:protein of unknown function [Micropruina glycogenica]|uniref:Uncharacterized protein n=1 Tax=Micropruina glycogenica TaxID=75385 RepID=A0A2N9JK69_9ACTN|nr:protein of unknown function [Micropruina glycogenica]
MWVPNTIADNVPHSKYAYIRCGRRPQRAGERIRPPGSGAAGGQRFGRHRPRGRQRLRVHTAVRVVTDRRGVGTGQLSTNHAHDLRNHHRRAGRPTSRVVTVHPVRDDAGFQGASLDVFQDTMDLGAWSDRAASMRVVQG